MSNLDIKFVNDLNFKYLHDLIIDTEPVSITFYEDYDDVDVNALFYIAHLLHNYLPEIELRYHCEWREKYPIDDLSPEFAFREVPFSEMWIGDNYYNLIDGNI